MQNRLLVYLLGGGSHPTSQLRGWYRRVLLHEAGPRSRFRLCSQAILWPCKLLLRAVSEVRRYGKPVAHRFGKSRARQYYEILRIGIPYGIEPEYYYQFRLFLAHPTSMARFFVSNRMHHRLLMALVKRQAAEEAVMIDSKDRFAQWCREHGLATIPLLAVFENGVIQVPKAEQDVNLPDADLFVKPADSRWGMGAYIIRFVGGGDFLDDDGVKLSKGGILSRLREESTRSLAYGKAAAAPRDKPSRILLQPRLRPHPAIEDLSIKALCTVRIVTARDTRGAIHVIGAAFRMGLGGSPVDNFSSGGIVSAVDLATGTLTAATYMRPLRCTEHLSRNPDTGALVEGRTLPLWPDALELVRNAHFALKRLSSVGWDVALTSGGPILVEANASWGADIMHVDPNNGLGNTAFARIFLEHIEQDWEERSC